MHPRISLLVVLVLVAGGCAHHRGSTHQKKVAPSTQPAVDDHLRYNDPRLSDEERHVLQAATDALSASKPAPNYDRTYRYDLWEEGDGWYVGILRIIGFDGDQPRFLPDSETWVTVDKNFHARITAVH